MFKTNLLALLIAMVFVLSACSYPTPTQSRPTDIPTIATTDTDQPTVAPSPTATPTTEPTPDGTPVTAAVITAAEVGESTVTVPDPAGNPVVIDVPSGDPLDQIKNGSAVWDWSLRGFVRNDEQVLRFQYVDGQIQPVWNTVVNRRDSTTIESNQVEGLANQALPIAPKLGPSPENLDNGLASLQMPDALPVSEISSYGDLKALRLSLLSSGTPVETAELGNLIHTETAYPGVGVTIELVSSFNPSLADMFAKRVDTPDPGHYTFEDENGILEVTAGYGIRVEAGRLIITIYVDSPSSEPEYQEALVNRILVGRLWWVSKQPSQKEILDSMVTRIPEGKPDPVTHKLVFVDGYADVLEAFGLGLATEPSVFAAPVDQLLVQTQP